MREDREITYREIKAAKANLEGWLTLCFSDKGPGIFFSSMSAVNFCNVLGPLITRNGEVALALLINNYKSRVRGGYAPRFEVALAVVGVLKLHPGNKEIADYLECICEETMMGQI